MKKMRNLGQCACCGGAPDCSPPLGLPRAYRVILQSLVGVVSSRSANSCGGSFFQCHEDRFAACLSLNGTYILNYAGPFTCNCQTEQVYNNAGQPFGSGPRSGTARFHYWIGDSFTLDGLSTVTVSNLPCGTPFTTADLCNEEDVPIITPDSYTFIAARKEGIGGTDVTNPGLPWLGGRIGWVYPASCIISLYLVPTVVLSNRITYLTDPGFLYGAANVSNNLCNFIYGQFGPANIWGDAPSIQHPGVCLENMVLNACYNATAHFGKSPYTGKLGLLANETPLPSKCDYTSSDYILMSEIS